MRPAMPMSARIEVSPFFRQDLHADKGGRRPDGGELRST
jgi:hypothetical protein